MHRKLLTYALMAGLWYQLSVAQIVARAGELYIADVSVARDRRVRITDSRGTEIIPKKEKRQQQCSSPKIADDRRTVGWLVEVPNCCTSYPIPLSLVVYRGGRVIRRFQPGQAIWDWQFLNAGNQVAFWIGPTHGEFVPHFELHDLPGGQLVAQWDGHLGDTHPAWVSGLKK
jgi:hypothetical protein